MVACLEEIAFRMGYIGRERPAASSARGMDKNAYGRYLARVAGEGA